MWSILLPFIVKGVAKGAAMAATVIAVKYGADGHTTEAIRNGLAAGGALAVNEIADWFHKRGLKNSADKKILVNTVKIDKVQNQVNAEQGGKR